MTVYTATSFDVRTDLIEVSTSLLRPDRRWTATDSHGHVNTWDTIRYVVTDEWTDEDGEEQTEGEYRCPHCAEPVTPGTTGPSPYREFIPGVRHFIARIEGYDVAPSVGDTVDVEMAGHQAKGVVVEVEQSFLGPWAAIVEG